jgi:hypothetical protein
MATFGEPSPCVQEGTCLCSTTWVLVIHNAFQDIDKYERFGNGADIRNIRRVFHEQRKCRFAELENRGRDDIIDILSTQEMLIQLFHPDGDCNSLLLFISYRYLIYFLFSDDPLKYQPDTFILFILSHGLNSGVILTDKFKKDTKPSERQFQTYTTREVFDILVGSALLESCLKIIFLGVLHFVFITQNFC